MIDKRRKIIKNDTRKKVDNACRQLKVTKKGLSLLLGYTNAMVSQWCHLDSMPSYSSLALDLLLENDKQKKKIKEYLEYPFRN